MLRPGDHRFVWWPERPTVHGTEIMVVSDGHYFEKYRREGVMGVRVGTRHETRDANAGGIQIPYGKLLRTAPLAGVPRTPPPPREDAV